MEEKLIDFVKNNEFLYNKRSRHYKNVYLREEKFSELSSQINIPAKKLKDRWRTLRDKFYKEIKKENLPSGSGSASPKKRWKWMEQLMFLKDVDMENLKTSGNFPIERNDNCSTSFSFTDENLSAPSPGFLTFSDPDVGDISCSTTHASSSSTKKKKIDEEILEAKSQMSEVVKLFKESLAQPQPPENPKSAAQIFFEGLAKQTDDANLTPLEFSMLQIRILNVFNDILQNKN